MFCPKCGDELVEMNDRLVCRSGRMELSQELAKRLRECFVARSRKLNEIKFGFRIGGNWFCPQCGVPTEEADGCVRCPQCGSNLNEFMFALTELAPHLGQGTETF